MEDIIIMGGFTIIGAVIGGIISYYGLDFLAFFRKKTQSDFSIMYNGTALEFDFSKYDGFIERSDMLKFKIQNFKITVRGKQVKGKGRVTTTHTDGLERNGTLKMIGRNIDKIVYAQYSVNEDKGGSWEGLGLLCIPRERSNIIGYWFTEDIYKSGKFSFGNVILNRVREETNE